jgi:hypothetical protein
MKGYKFPKTVIITVTTHGRIPLDEKGEPQLFTLPQGMSLTKISSVVPGVCNIMSSDDSDYYNEVLIEWLKKLSQRDMFENKHELAEEIAKFMKKEDMENVLKEVETEVKERKKQMAKKNRKSDEDEDEEEYYGDDDEEYEPDDEDIEDEKEELKKSEAYLHHWNKNYPISIFENVRRGKRRTSTIQNQVINKEYIREESTEQFESPWDFKITVLNMEGYPDLMRLLTGRHHYGLSAITLEEIVIVLSEFGVKNIILVDFSCSVLQDENDVISEPDERTQRVMRRELLKQGLHGGLFTKTKHHTYRRHRKRTAKRKQMTKRRKTMRRSRKIVR